MDLTAAMIRYERARNAAMPRHGGEPAPEALAELAAARVAVVELLAEEEGWQPEPRIDDQIAQDRALLASLAQQDGAA